MHPYSFTHTYNARHYIIGVTPVVLIGYYMFICNRNRNLFKIPASLIPRDCSSVLAAAAGLAVNPAAEVADKLANFFSFLARFSAAVLRSGFFSTPGRTGSSPAVLDLKYFKYCL